MAHGKGITKKSLEQVLKSGVDLVTLGDHTWDQKESAALLEDQDIPLIRPANFPAGLPGQGYRLHKVRTKNILVINLIGRVFMRQQYDDPFRKADEIIENEGENADAIIIDFHAEATAEKVCLGWYCDGRVSAIIGTHTHIPTADARILPQGTAYITDVGMVGPRDSSLGLDKDEAIKSALLQIPIKADIAEGPVEINAVFLEIKKDSRAKKIKHLQKIVD